MKAGSYKKLGEFIQQVNVRNRDLETETLLGVSITKKLIPSIANVIGTDMSTYKVIEKGQFAYGTVTSRNGDKISVALSDEYEKALVSQIYIVFEIVDTEELLPEYLIMWFSRPEFDRYARYHSHGSTRETFDWADMCEVELPIPPIEEQRQIVAQYESVANKIKVNEQICEKLEAAAQALYKHWFVDFEFPVGHREERGTRDEAIPALVAEERSLYASKQKGYKSSGGKMVWNEELGKEIPEGWKVSYLSKIANYKNGLAMQNFPFENYESSLGVLKIRELGLGQIDNNSDRCTDNLPADVIIDNGDIIFSWSGTLKIDIWTGTRAGLNQHLFKVTSKKYAKWFYYYSTKYHLVEFIRIANSNKTSLGHIKKEHLDDALILLSNKSQMTEMANVIEEQFNYIINLKNQNQKLSQLQSLLSSRLAVGEEVSA